MGQNGATLTDKELRLIEELRKISFGKVVIIIEDNQPVRIVETSKGTKL